MAWDSTYHLIFEAASGDEGQHREPILPFEHLIKLAGQHRTMCSCDSPVAENKLSCRNIGIGAEDISAVVENVPGHGTLPVPQYDRDCSYFLISKTPRTGTSVSEQTTYI